MLKAEYEDEEPETLNSNIRCIEMLKLKNKFKKLIIVE